MSTAERIYELIKDLPETDAAKVLGFVHGLRARGVAITRPQRDIDWTVFRELRGCYDGAKIDRDEFYDRVRVC